MKKTLLLLVIWLSCTAVVFSAVSRMGVEPGMSSGNGNPALLIAWLLLPLFCLLVWSCLRIIHYLQIGKGWLIGLSAAGFVAVVAGFVRLHLQMEDYRSVIREALIRREGVADPEYVKAITGFLSIHMNSQTFSFLAFVLFVLLSLLIGLACRLMDGEPDAEVMKDDRRAGG